MSFEPFFVIAFSLPLVWRSVANIADEVTAFDGASVVRAWAVAGDLEVVDWHIDGDDVTLVVAGPTAPSGVDQLAGALAVKVGHPVALEVTYQPVVHYEADAD